MENTKAKNIIICVLIILLLCCLGVVVWQYITINDSKNVLGKEENFVNKQQNTEILEVESESQGKEDIQEEQQDNKQEESKIDPYKNYKDYVWSATKVKSGIDSTIEIKSGKVYVTYKDYETNKETTLQVKNIKGTPKKVACIVSGGADFFHILTQEGQVYELGATETKAWLYADLSKYNVIDMTSGKGRGVVIRDEYYLTAEGKLIDKNGDTFEEVNRDFVDFFGHMDNLVYIDSNNYLYHSKNGDANYITIKDSKGNKVKAQNMYIDFDEVSTVIVLTTDKQVIYVNKSGKISQETGKFKSVDTYNLTAGTSSMMTILMDTNKSIVKMNIADYYYDAKKPEEMLYISKEKEIESIKVYKYSGNSDSEFYPNVIVLSDDEIQKIQSDFIEIEESVVKPSKGNEDVFKVEIKTKEGKKLNIKLYVWGALLDINGNIYHCREISESLAAKAEKFKWSN